MRKTAAVDVKLLEFATPRQRQCIQAVIDCGSIGAAARKIGVDHAQVSRSVASARLKAAIRGYAPEGDMTHTAPSPFTVNGVSTYYDEDGAVRGQWVKTKLDDELVEQAIKEAIAGLSEDMPRLPAVKAPKDTINQLVNLYTLTDCHVGMRSWAPETGEDWDLDIAERVLISAFHQMIESCPPAAIGFVNQLGDFLHYDGLSPVTPLHGNILDADGRYPKVVSVAVRILRSVIDAALLKHKKVIVLMAEGNHDPASSVWLRHIFSLLYEKEPRVEVMENTTTYYAYQHGETMLAFHHGHLSKNAELPMLFAAQFPQMWGLTTRRYCHTGHRHHVEEKEHGGITVIQHPTIASRDAFAARGGWIADRAMTAITYHTKYGQVARTTVVPEMMAK